MCYAAFCYKAVLALELTMKQTMELSRQFAGTVRKRLRRLIQFPFLRAKKKARLFSLT